MNRLYIYINVYLIKMLRLINKSIINNNNNNKEENTNNDI